jgi:hypothetical protein
VNVLHTHKLLTTMTQVSKNFHLHYKTFPAVAKVSLKYSSNAAYNQRRMFALPKKGVSPLQHLSKCNLFNFASQNNREGFAPTSASHEECKDEARSAFNFGKSGHRVVHSFFAAAASV